MNLLKVMKRRAQQLSGGNSNFRDVRKRSDSSTDDSTLSNETEDAPWRVENILVDGAPCEEDWWGTGGFWDVDEGVEIDMDEEEPDDDGAPVFRNRGYETWLQVQQAWRGPERLEATETKTTPTPVSRKPVLKRALVKQISQHREFELRKKVQLKDIVSAYHNVWAEDSD